MLFLSEKIYNNSFPNFQFSFYSNSTCFNSLYTYYCYKSFFYSTIFIIIVASIVFLLNFFAKIKQNDVEKLLSYECGLNPFVNTRNVQKIQYFKIAILFLIFHVETLFLIPWCLNPGLYGISGFLSLVSFFILITIGYILEWLCEFFEFVNTHKKQNIFYLQQKYNRVLKKIL